MAGRYNISYVLLSASVRADEYLSAFVLIFNKKLLIGGGYEQTEYYFHACTNPPDVACKHKMTPRYTYTASTDFINDLTFDYVETYSFQRGQEFEEYKKNSQVEYDKLKAKKDKHHVLSTDEEKIFLTLDELLGNPQYLINNKGQFHLSSKRTHIFLHGDQNIDRIKNILQTKINDIPRWLCAPVYRDALVFYNSDNKIVSVLNICLSCQYMETKMFDHINGDYETYDLFKRFFIDMGHDVEDPEHFVLDDINKLKSKYKK